MIRILLLPAVALAIAAAPAPAPTPTATATPDTSANPQAAQHAINEKGTAGTKGGVKGTTGVPQPADPCRNPGPCPPPS